MPSSIRTTRPLYLYGTFLHSLVQLRSQRQQSHGTFFFRNRPELALMRKAASQLPEGASLKVAVLACSNGAEVYSIVWTIRSARPDLKVIVQGVDISKDIVEAGKAAIYCQKGNELMNASMFARITKEEVAAMFDCEDEELRIKPWLKENIQWQIADVSDPRLCELVGTQDMVVANKFLCHMDPADAERCLRNVARVVKPGGYLFVSGVDLEIRSKVACDLGWTPVRVGMEDMHNGDVSVRNDWPWKYWGLEPFDRKRHDWASRYASVFRVGVRTSTNDNPTMPCEDVCRVQAE